MRRRLTLNQKTRLLQYSHFLGVLISLYWISWTWFAVGLFAYAFFETFGGNIGLHRYFGHRCFKTSRFNEAFLCTTATLVGAGSTISWVGTHRYHHQHADTPKDVHSPYFQTYFNIIAGEWDVKVTPSMVKDLVRDPMHKFFHKNYFMVHMVWATLLLLINFKLFLFAYCWPSFFCLQSGYVLAIWAHRHGYQTYDTGDQARNSWFASIYTLGEGWHNNHHMFPDRLRQGEKWWEFDLPAVVIERLLARK